MKHEADRENGAPWGQGGAPPDAADREAADRAAAIPDGALPAEKGGKSSGCVVRDTFARVMAGSPVPRRSDKVDCGALPFVIRRDGTWLYRGSPIARKEMVCLFSSVLQREADGSFWLDTPAERGRIEVEDAPFVAVALDWIGDGRGQVLSFRTNVDQIITAGPEHPIRIAHDILTCEPTPYLHIRDGVGAAPVEARICRAVYYELVALAVTGRVRCQDVLGVWSQGRFFPLGELPRCGG